MKQRIKSLKKSLISTLPKGGKKRRQDVKLHQHFLARYRANKEKRLRKRAEYLASLPKGRWQRLKYVLHPKRVASFVFSRDGLILGLRITGISVVLGMVALFVMFAYFRRDLPKNITDLTSCSQGQKTSYYDRTGEVLLWRGEGDVDCRPVALSEISPYLQKAVIAAEDQTFFKHPGFDVKGLINAAISNATTNSGRGGSTITQQYVKLAVLKDNERSINRKIKELILAIELERSYKKEEILQAYLNEVSFGSVYNGAEAASRGFFDKSAKDLTLDEAATFAAAIQAPGAYWDYDTEGLVERKNNYVLPQMVSLGLITKEEAEIAKQTDTLTKQVQSKSKYKDIRAPHFVIEVQRQLEEEFGVNNIRSQGYKVITTLDMTKQQMAEESVSEGMAAIDRGGLNNAALVAEDVASGHVLAYVGSRDFNYPGFGEKNVAGTPRSPGSSWKPFDYASLMKSSENWGAGSIMYDLDTTWSGFGPPYSPKNYDFLQPGPVSIRYALGGSRNTPAIKAMYIAGIKQTQDLAIAMGMRSGVVNCGLPCDQILSTAIGDGGEVRLDENVHAYGTFSRMGKYIPQQFVLKILDSRGKVIRDNTAEPVGEQVLDPQIAYIVNDMLADTRASYFRGNGGARQLNGYQDRDNPTAIKTGTTNNSDNGWMMGYTSEIAVGVWVGHNENRSATNFMENMTGPLFGGFMRRVYEGKPAPAYWQRPEGIKEVAHDTTFYNLAKGACTGVRNGNICGWGQSDIYPSWYTPRKLSNQQQKVVIDTVSGKRATECTPVAARKEVIGGGIIVPEIGESDPNFKNFMDPIRSRIKTGIGESIPAEDQIDTVHKCDDIKPEVSLSPISSCTSICTITATVKRGTHGLATLYFKMDGQTLPGGAIELQDGANVGSTFTKELTITPDWSGERVITAQVIDDALYDDTSTEITVNFTSESFSLQDITQSGSNITFIWDKLSSASGVYQIIRTSDGTVFPATCSASGTKCSYTRSKTGLGSGTQSFSIRTTVGSVSRETNRVDETL